MSRKMKSSYAWLFVLTALTVILVAMLSACSVPGLYPVNELKINPKTMRQVIFVYEATTSKTEIVFCGFGYMRNDTLHWERTEMADVASNKEGWRAWHDSIYAHCPSNALLRGHTHPKEYGARACGFSNADLRNIAQSDQPVGMVLCYDSTNTAPYGVVWLSKWKVINDILPKSKEEENAKRKAPPN